MTAIAAEALPQEVLAKLFAILKGWADGMEAFRYEMFARRLVAAEHGRPDAVEWAQSWYNDVMEEERQQQEARQREIERQADLDANARAEFRAGRCGNPHYQAYLDTIEHPELIANHAPYMAWIDMLIGKFERMPGIKDLPKPEQTAIWRRMLLAERDAHLASRLNGRPTPIWEDQKADMP